jgi:hypothetical protein
MGLNELDFPKEHQDQRTLYRKGDFFSAVLLIWQGETHRSLGLALLHDIQER